MDFLKTTLLALFVSVALVSCEEENTLGTFKGEDFTFVGVAEKFEEKTVEWNGSAKVSVLDGVSNVLYQPLASGEQVKFTSVQGIDDNAMDVYAVWPYSDEHERVLGGVKVYLDSEHMATQEIEGLRVAYASDIEQEEVLHFKNVVSYLSLSITKDMEITEVVLSGLDSETLSGLAHLEFSSEGEPVVKEVSMASKTISLTSDGEILEGEYMIPLFPMTMSRGCVLEFMNADGYLSKVEKTEELKFERNAAVDFGPLPTELNWKKAPKVRVNSISPNSVTVSWTISSWSDIVSDYTGKYTIGIYSDRECTTAVVEEVWDKRIEDMPEGLTELTYVFEGLQPVCDYWIKVTDNLTNASSNVIPVVTLNVVPSLRLGTVFWSDVKLSWSSDGIPDKYRVYLDGELKEETLESEYHLKGLSCGTEYNVCVAAVTDEREDRSEPVVFKTGAISQMTTNISPTSLSVSIENRAGNIDDNEKSPAIYVELYEGESAEPLFASIVIDAQTTSSGMPFLSSKAISSDDSAVPTNITFGCLSPSTSYRFRVKSYAEYSYTDYKSASTGKSEKLTSSNGDSEWSEPVYFKTSDLRPSEDDDVLYQGFDNCFVNQDFINKAAGTVPAYKAAKVEVGALSFKTISEWADKWAFYSLRMNQTSSQFAQYKWIEGVGKNQTYPCTTSTSSTVTEPEFLKDATAYKFNATASDDLQDWYISNSSWPYQGYIGLGTSYTYSDGETTPKHAFIITGPLSKNLSDVDVTCTLTFKALAMYGKKIPVNVAKVSSDGKWSDPIKIYLTNSAGTKDKETKWPKDDNHKWHEQGCEISLKKGDRLAIAVDFVKSNDNTYSEGGHALIDDILIKVKQ